VVNIAIKGGHLHEVTVDVGKDILAANRREAEKNLAVLNQYDIRAYDILGAIGSGKTALIEKVTPLLQEQGYGVGAVAGDVAGEDDYLRMKGLGIPVVNINTGKECHLDAHLVHHALEQLPLSDLDFLFIENVGNMVCPADFPLGTHERMIIVSVTEGDDVVRKHPMIFQQCATGIINKIDLADAVGADVTRMEADMKRVAPPIHVIKSDLKRGVGVSEFVGLLVDRK